ncbi:MAG: preprotein translocase subunit SecE [Patescibacteria group bacterium]|jgi:preprotein translocase subunit SecE
MNKIARYFSEVREELKKVSWPKRKQVAYDTTSVIITIVISILLLVLIDAAFAKLVNLVIIGDSI